MALPLNWYFGSKGSRWWNAEGNRRQGGFAVGQPRMARR
jgi:hypothetical protein